MRGRHTLEVKGVDLGARCGPELRPGAINGTHGEERAEEMRDALIQYLGELPSEIAAEVSLPPC